VSKHALDFTHIRRPREPYERFCGADHGGSISYFHYMARRENPAIEGHIDRLPEPMCPDCIATLSLSVCGVSRTESRSV
jgi:hypothetical protein